ncbi:MAG: MgtC/SapB family protein [Erysipelotrichaceae bacterium]|nr:MgtC/SapB family protein [Erysipelotrichaceae bacterium]
MGLSTFEIFSRLLLSMIFSGLIGFEREKSNSNAGMKTHILVGMGATIVALIQVETNLIVKGFGPESKVGVDAVRLIAQVISGVGFLGAGTIIVTKRNIIGLTTAASIWGIASVGTALGMGYFNIAIIGTALILLSLLFFKKIWIVQSAEYIIIKYITNDKTINEINKSLEKLDLSYETVRWSTSPFGHDLITTHVFKVNLSTSVSFGIIVETISKIDNIISIELSNIG